MKRHLAIISDVHGCYYTLLRLLNWLPASAEVIFGGDLIDRGPNSRQVVDFAMRNMIPTVMGNHEDLMLAHYGRESVGYEPGCWLMNGGEDTIESYGTQVPASVLDWVEGLPMELKYGDLRVSHTAAGRCGDRKRALWERDVPRAAYAGFRVFGHTPGKFVVMGENFARIDTGAAYASRGFGVLTAFLWPEMRVVSQPYDETPCGLERKDVYAA